MIDEVQSSKLQQFINPKSKLQMSNQAQNPKSSIIISKSKIKMPNQ